MSSDLSERLLKRRAAKAVEYLQEHGDLDGFGSQWAAIENYELAAASMEPQEKRFKDMDTHERAELFRRVGPEEYRRQLLEAKS